MAQVLVMLGVVFVAVVCLSAVVVAAWVTWRQTARSEASTARTPAGAALVAGSTRLGSATDDPATSVAGPQFDRVVRVISLLFLAAVGTVVLVSRAYPETEVAIQLLVSAGILAVVFLQDLLPTAALGQGRRWIEAALATGFVAVLTGLTGGLSSPFFVGFFLVVAGASLSLEEAAPLLLALLAAGSYALVGVAVAAPDELGAGTLAWLGFNVVSLSLLAFLASVVGREQRRAREAAISLSRFDPLTGLFNRNYFFSVLDQEIRRAARSGGHFAVLMIDLDDMKPVNDTFGHQQGDELLRGVTSTIQKDLRSTDIAARYGGDEFVVLLSDTDAQGAHTVAEKLRSDIAQVAVGSMDRPARTTVSVGLVSYPEDGTTVESLISDVDRAMYESKRRGKNQIVGYTTRTERVATPVTPPRTSSTMEREPSRILAREPSRPPPGAPLRETGSRPETASMGGRPVSRRSDETLRPAWDSTAPAAPGGADGEPRSYVAIHVQRPQATGQANEPVVDTER
ncbi:MAG: hypothetical protein QOH61_2117 [Chloroflexota bacterium]|jgi:diguanylate cyclase (GGDEF)-like protein|nr:hypothetical protein [Chloroflexota bacterium]